MKEKHKRRKKRWLLGLFQRRILIGLIILLQIAFYILLLITGSRQFAWINYSLTALSILTVIYVINTDKKFSYKLSWVVLLLAVPIVGGMLYILFHIQGVTIRVAKAQKLHFGELNSLFNAPETVSGELSPYETLASFLKNANFPVYYNNGDARYFSSGEEFFVSYLDELKKARRYIFLEYFIISEGEMWDAILEILEQKAAEGVDVRVMYDDVGCFLSLPSNYPKLLSKKGIKCYCFNKFRPIITTIQNNRDHRKITVIDGVTAFTGGVNLADEYINAIERFGHWKDSAVMIKGDAARSFAVIFLQMWGICTGSYDDCRNFDFGLNEPVVKDGYVQPYADSPLDKENVGEQVYMKLISGAKKYLYITTPYLIIDDSMTEALKTAAKSGVDVRIITPQKFDKRIIHWATISYYRELIAAGIGIYEYTDGFIHSKVFLSDDEIATVGTVNLDFRSLYLHFENGVVLYGGEVLNQIHKDFEQTFEICTPIYEKDCKRNIFLRIFQSLLKLFAPLI